MNICMIVHNSGARDGRVMREAHTLQAAGHTVTVVGIPEPNATAPLERLSDGVLVRRVDWYPRARRRLVISAIPRTLLFLALLGAAGYGIWRAALWLISPGGPLAKSWAGIWAAASGGGTHRGLGAAYVSLAGLAAGLLLWCGILVVRGTLKRRAREKDLIRRQVISGTYRGSARFPAIRSRIPDWLPDWVLEIAVEPLDWFGARTGKFSQYRYRSEELAAAAIALKPDIVHCHDCIALPTGWMVKKALGIPLVYDAHEIYEAVAARRFGATDYFARVHRRYLPRIDGFVAVNDSAAVYYRHAYPAAPPAVVIRNATDHLPAAAYDGRLHRAAGLPADEKILLYQGGFTQHRGLQVLVRSGALLPDGWSLAMMGWGPLAAELERIAEAQEQGARKKVHFVPAVPPAELLSWTQGAAAGIVPYEDRMLNHWIATPNKLWEYPSAGVPLIVQPFPEMRRIVENYRCGWVLPHAFNPEAIAALVGGLSDEMLAAARAGCCRFIEVDNWQAAYQPRLLALYDNLALQVAGKHQRSNAGIPPGPVACQASRVH